MDDFEYGVGEHIMFPDIGSMSDGKFWNKKFYRKGIVSGTKLEDVNGDGIKERFYLVRADIQSAYQVDEKGVRLDRYPAE